MATVPALVLSRDEVRLLLKRLGAHLLDYAFSRDQYREMEETGALRLIETMQWVARQED